ncbi:MAG: UDP-N-acetylmuramoyl-tripeptide--D-alanyl-D-alanine ligase [Ruminococcaceae bacterium]|nr:UDP-N-acetylmuramoyl-tripeptide--D-alanyl-D-alanine ligase [Oscillospiraceae bacterium]
MKIKLGLGKANMRDVAMWCSGELYDFSAQNGCDFEYVCTDSREADENTMFVATRGERVDGHDYISKALDLGCRCVLCEYVPTDISGREAAFAVVENSVEAFSRTARGYRSGKAIDTVAITGSVGKTTTKELCASIIKRHRALYYTQGNFNSVIGMPMSLMEAPRECDAAVFEMGMSGLGEIRSMTLTALPKVAMVTNVGSSHLEYLKTRENIARAKLEIAEGLCDGGYLLLNGDEPLLREIKPKTDADIKTLYVGLDGQNGCTVNAFNIRVGEDGTRFDLCVEDKTYRDLKINLIGRAFVYNAAFAAVAAMLLGAGEDDVRLGLADYYAQSMRQSIQDRDGVTVVMDCYNASPESMRSAIDTLAALKVDGKRIAVLGDMRELGDDSDAMHADIGRYVADKGIDALLTLGSGGAIIAESAKTCGVACERVISVSDVDGTDELARALCGMLQKGDAVLFKASRSLRLERVADAAFAK